MGWLFMSKHHMNGFSSPKSYLDDQFTYAPDEAKARTSGLRVLKSVWSGSVYYAAAEPYERGQHPGDVLAIICLVRWNPASRSNEHFGYKDMDETMGPNEAACPASILDLLGPPRNEYAANWRRACRARLALTTRPKPDEGDKIIFQTPITFADGYEAQRFTVKRHGRQLALRGENGGLYRVRRFMEQRWSCIPATNVFGARDKR